MRLSRVLAANEGFAAGTDFRRGRPPCLTSALNVACAHLRGGLSLASCGLGASRRRHEQQRTTGPGGGVSASGLHPAPGTCGVPDAVAVNPNPFNSKRTRGFSLPRRWVVGSFVTAGADGPTASERERGERARNLRRGRGVAPARAAIRTCRPSRQPPPLGRRQRGFLGTPPPGNVSRRRLCGYSVV